MDTAQRRLEARELYVDERLSLQGIAERLSVSTTTVAKDLRRLGVDLRQPGRPPEPHVLERRAVIAATYPERSIAQLADRLGVSPRTVWSDVVALGLERRPQGGSIDAAALERRQAVAADEGRSTLAELAKRFGVAPSTIQNDQRALGILASRRPGRRRRSEVGDNRPRQGCARPGCERSFVAYPSEEARRRYCSFSCRTIEQWRTGRVSRVMLSTAMMRRRWGGRWGARLKGGRPPGKLSYWTNEALPKIERAREAFVRERGREPSLRELEALTQVPRSTLARLSQKPS